MFLLKFNHNEKSWFLHNGRDAFEGSDTHEGARRCSIGHTAKSFAIDGFEIVEVTVEKLSEMIGGVPYHIIDFHGGMGIPFWGVEIVKQ